MTKTLTVRKRGFFGWIFLILFLAFNAYMAAAIAFGIWQRWIHGIGITETMVFGTLVVVWCIGSVILGLLALLTRGSKSVTTEIKVAAKRAGE
jgi:hypothetical protein